MIFSAEIPQLPVLQTRSQWCSASSTRDVYSSCLVLSWHPQHSSYQARRYLNQSKRKTKRRMLLEIVRLTFRCGHYPENCLKQYVQIGSRPPPQQETCSCLPGPGASARWDWRPEITFSCLHGSKHIRANPSVFLVLCSIASILNFFLPEEEGVRLLSHHRSTSIPVAN